MNKSNQQIKICYLIPDQYWSSTVTSAIEVFHGLGLNAKALSNASFSNFEITLLRTTRNKVTGFSGFALETNYFNESEFQSKQFDAIIVPSVWNLSLSNLKEAKGALTWLASQHENGALIAGLVTGVFFLAEAGLLDSREATVHWASVNVFKQRYPTVKLNPQLEMIETERVITTASTPATFDVALLIIQRFLGDQAAEYASHYFTIKDKDSPLPTFLEPSSSDTLVDAARDIIKQQFSNPLSLEALSRELNVTSRTLSRRFLNATGISPIQYLIKQRLNSARNLLRSTDRQVQQVAEQCGFGSATVFGRQFKQEYGQTPREFREELNRTR